ncbi:MAG: hypothetical protein ACRDSR_00490 [Pseudonocardiaceae bacterium]
MPDPRTLAHVDTLRLPVKQPFNFRYTLWKPSHVATGLGQHSAATSWRTFRVGEPLTGVVRTMDGDDTVRAEVYADGAWQAADHDRLTLFEIAIISLLLQNATVARTTQMMTNLLDHYGRVVTFDGQGQVLRSVADAPEGTELRVRLSDGAVHAVVTSGRRDHRSRAAQRRLTLGGMIGGQRVMA